MDKNVTQDVLIRNVVFLMSQLGITFADVDRLTNKPMEGSYLRKVVKREREPSTGVIDRIGTLFGLTGYEMLNPTLPEEYIEKHNVKEVVEKYLASTVEGKLHIVSAAEIAPKK